MNARRFAVASFVALGSVSAAFSAELEVQQNAQATRPSLYVAPFTGTQGIDAQVLSSFTSDFETGLVYSGCYDVLERRDIDQLLAQIRNERALGRIQDLGLDATQQ